MCLLAWYDKATSKYDVFSTEVMSSKFSYFNFLPCSGNLRKIVSKIVNFQTFISLDFNLQSNREFLRYKALKMHLEEVHYYCKKYKILPKGRKKATKRRDFEST